MKNSKSNENLEEKKKQLVRKRKKVISLHLELIHVTTTIFLYDLQAIRRPGDNLRVYLKSIMFR